MVAGCQPARWRPEPPASGAEIGGEVGLGGLHEGIEIVHVGGKDEKKAVLR